jgi:hypothetical protein
VLFLSVRPIVWTIELDCYLFKNLFQLPFSNLLQLHLIQVQLEQPQCMSNYPASLRHAELDGAAFVGTALLILSRLIYFVAT